MKTQHLSHRNNLTYLKYIALSILLTLLLNYCHSYLLGIETTTLGFIMPGIAGIVFGYLLARNHILHLQLVKRASIDVLTGTYNRMQCNYFLLAEIDKVNRY